ncbi:hypothetical protein [Tsuneonella sp. SYSU-LHT278]|uniref:hypothetical protein n=1 Tax=Tsuneonella sediminis TaxID=3416089 RepID=UPI003F7A5F3E
MNAIPTDLARADGVVPRPLASMDAQWTALQDAANAVATLAGLVSESPSTEVRDFPSAIAEAGGWRLELAANGLADLAAMMTPGVRALLAVSARGQDPVPAALTLWREYHRARAALLALVPRREPPGQTGR